MLDKQTAAYGAFLLRVSLGVLFLAHGALKLFVFTPAGTVEFFASLGLPPAVADLTMLAELGGGALLLAGVMTRRVALALVPFVLGTIIFDHGANGWIFSSPGGGWEFPAFWTVTLMVQALLGDGAFALSVPFHQPRPAPAI
jgi:putative oxidoreductase